MLDIENAKLRAMLEPEPAELVREASDELVAAQEATARGEREEYESWKDAAWRTARR